MKKNRCFKPDILSKICDKTAYLCFPHLSTESQSRSKVDYALYGSSPRLRKPEGQGNRQPRLWSQERKLGLRTRRRVPPTLTAPVCASVSTSGFQGHMTVTVLQA